MIIPKKFKLAGIEWVVIESPELGDANGLCSRDKASIWISKELTPAIKELTFLHELGHAIRFTLGNLGPHDEVEVDQQARLYHQYLLTAK